MVLLITLFSFLQVACADLKHTEMTPIIYKMNPIADPKIGDDVKVDKN